MGVPARITDRLICRRTPIHRPVGNVRKVPAGGCRLRFRRDGSMRTAPQAFDSRAAAERALCDLADGGRADFNHDGRFRTMVLLTTFASLRWGEVNLERSNISLEQPRSNESG